MFDSVIVGVDGKPGGRDAVALAARLAAPPGGLTLAHVHSRAVSVAREESHELLQREQAASGVAAQLVSYVAMTPGRGLHALAEEQQADLLVVGSSSRGLLGRALLKDDTRASLNGAPCAVAVASSGYAADPAPIATIGVGFDGSPESDGALATARTLAERIGAGIRALEVVSIPSYAYTGIVPPAMGEGLEMMTDEASARMAAVPGVEGSAVYGLPGEELAALGDQVDLLVVGSRNYGPMRRLVLGSTSDYLAHHARCSLLVMPRMAGRDEQAAED